MSEEVRLVEISKERYWEMLEAVPPIEQERGGFLLGEADHHIAGGIPVYTGFFEVGDKFYQTHCAITRTRFGEMVRSPKPQENPGTVAWDFLDTWFGNRGPGREEEVAKILLSMDPMVTAEFISLFDDGGEITKVMRKIYNEEQLDK